MELRWPRYSPISPTRTPPRIFTFVPGGSSSMQRLSHALPPYPHAARRVVDDELPSQQRVLHQVDDADALGFVFRHENENWRAFFYSHPLSSEGVRTSPSPNSNPFLVSPEYGPLPTPMVIKSELGAEKKPASFPMIPDLIIARRRQAPGFVSCRSGSLTPYDALGNGQKQGGTRGIYVRRVLDAHRKVRACLANATGVDSCSSAMQGGLPRRVSQHWG